MIGILKQRQSPSERQRAGRAHLSMNRSEERDWLTRVARERDREAFEQLYHRYNYAAYSLAMRITGHPDQAQEVLQEAMLIIWRSAANFRVGGNPFGWAMKIVVRQALRASKRESKAASNSEIDLDERDPGLEKTDQPSTERREQAEALQRELSRLPTLQRRILTLHYGAEISQQQIAELLSIPPRTVSFRIQQALRTLRESLAATGFSALSGAAFQAKLTESLRGGFRPPEGMFKNLGSRMDEPGQILPENIAAIKSNAPFWTKNSPWLLAGIAFVGALGALTIGDSKQTPLKPSSPTTHPQNPTRSGSTKAVAQTLHRTWNFERGIPSDLKTIWGAVQWARPTKTRPGMACIPAKQFTLLLVDLPFPASTYKVLVRGAILDIRYSNIKCAPFKASRNALISGAVWSRSEKLRPGLMEKQFFLIDRYLITKTHDKIAGIRAYEESFEGSKLALIIQNFALVSLEITSCDLPSLPSAYQDIPTLIQTLRLKKNYFPGKPFSFNPNQASQSPAVKSLPNPEH